MLGWWINRISTFSTKEQLNGAKASARIGGLEGIVLRAYGRLVALKLSSLEHIAGGIPMKLRPD
jgi:hypothetical protein